MNTRKLALVLTFTLPLLAACGVDGAPQAPEVQQPAPAVSVTGEARIGVTHTR